MIRGSQQERPKEVCVLSFCRATKNESQLPNRPWDGDFSGKTEPNSSADSFR